MKIKPRYVKSSVAVEEPLRPSAALNKVNLRFSLHIFKAEISATARTVSIPTAL